MDAMIDGMQLRTQHLLRIAPFALHRHVGDPALTGLVARQVILDAP